MPGRSGSFFSRLQKAFALLVGECQLKPDEVQVMARPLSPEESFGSTPHEDAAEYLLQAELLGCRGQAFTVCQGHFNGALEDVLALPLTDDFQRALYTANLNAVACYASKADNTVHCRDKGPELCASQVADFLQKNFGRPRILMIGFQAELAEALGRALSSSHTILVWFCEADRCRQLDLPFTAVR